MDTKHRYLAAAPAPEVVPPIYWNYYVNWTLYSILGRLHEADGVLSKYKKEIYSVARFLQETFSAPKKLLYRGVLLAPNEVRGGVVKPDLNYRSVSFTEDRDVACFFADPRSSVSSYVTKIRPGVSGYIAEYRPALREILFHHGWQPLPAPWGESKLADLAHAHLVVGPQAFQVDWSLRTQAEVITKPIRIPLRVTPIEDSRCADTSVLEQRLGPKWQWTT